MPPIDFSYAAQITAHLLTRLRCPDCGSKLQSPTETDRDSFLFTCPCGNVLRFQDDVLLALPHAMGSDQTANLQHYDAMSQAHNGLLQRRATTRNHMIKARVVAESLRLADAPTLSVLELGTGFGAHAVSICDKGHYYVGLDISPGLLQTAADRFPCLKDHLLVGGDATNIPFLDNTFDGTFCVATVHHLPDPALGIKEMIRVLKPGGRFCFLEPWRFYPTQLLQYLREPATEVSALKISPNNLFAWCKAAGAEEVFIGRHIFTPNRPYMAEALYSAIDKFMERSHLFKRLSVMISVHGTKPL